MVCHMGYVTKMPQNPYGFQFKKVIPDNTFDAGDVVMIKIVARTTDGGIPESKTGQVEFNIESNAATPPKAAP